MVLFDLEPKKLYNIKVGHLFSDAVDLLVNNRKRVPFCNIDIRVLIFEGLKNG